MARTDWGQDRARWLSGLSDRPAYEKERAAKRAGKALRKLSAALDLVDADAPLEHRAADKWARENAAVPKRAPIDRTPWAHLEDRARELRREAKTCSGATRAAMLSEAETLERQAYDAAVKQRTVLPAR